MVIVEIEPGTKLNLQVAETVFAEKKPEDFQYLGEIYPWDFIKISPRGGWTAVTAPVGQGPFPNDPMSLWRPWMTWAPLQFSSRRNLAITWTVVEKMLENDRVSFEMNAHLGGGTSAQFTAFDEQGVPFGGIHICGDPAVAICVAAVRAKEAFRREGIED
jgi:hypothetical protein